MARKQRKPAYSPEQTIIAFGVGCLACAGISYVAEITYDFLIDNGEKLPMVPGWRAHMISACLGISAFMLAFYSLEVLGRQSKAVAWRASLPWLPLVGFTAVATMVHVPAYIVIPLVLVYGIWAFRRMRSVR
jgi:hypothetical protein